MSPRTLLDEGLAVVTSAFGLSEAELIRRCLTERGIDVVIRRADCSPAPGDPVGRYVLVPYAELARARASLGLPAA